MTRNAVVPEATEVSEEEFRAALLTGLADAEKQAGGPGTLADALGVCTRQLTSIRNGTTKLRGLKRVWDAHARFPHVLRHVAAKYGYQLVPSGTAHSCIGENFKRALSRAHLWADDSMHSDSDHGTDLSRKELLAGEPALLELQHELEVMLRMVEKAKKYGLHSVPGHADRVIASNGEAV